MGQIIIKGYSDDLISIEGDITEEFSYKDSDDQGDILAFSDGTLLRIEFSHSGVWRVAPIAKGTGELSIVQAPEDDDDNGTDVATVDGAEWVVQGVDYQRTRR